MAWSNSQKATWHQYRRYAGISTVAGHELLRRATGCASSTDPEITQRDFDVAMSLIETCADLARANGRGVGKPPARLRDWRYWRKRCPRKGGVHTRQLWQIERLWDMLAPHLSVERRTHDYLVGIASQAAGRTISRLHELRGHEASWVVEALKGRLSQAYRDANLRHLTADEIVVEIGSMTA